MASEPSKQSLTDKLKILRTKEEEKKKELEELKKKLEEDSKKIEDEITNTVRVLRYEEEREFEKTEKTENLEEITSGENVEEEKNLIKAVLDYNVLETKNVYDVANREFYDKVKYLVEKSEKGYISQQEKNFLSKVTYKITQMKTENEYARGKKDPKNYLSRMDSLLLNVGDDW